MAARTILVVEDDDSMRVSITRLLCSAGFACAEFGSAEDALADPASQDAACVVSDMKLPGKSGLELLTELRVRKVESPFILITGHDSPSVREEARRRCAAYLVKPSLGPTLLDAVRAAFGPGTLPQTSGAPSDR